MPDFKDEVPDLTGIDEAHHALYAKQEDGTYKFAVPQASPDVAALKVKLEAAIKDGSKSAAELSKIKADIAAAEIRAKADSGQYKELYDRNEAEKAELAEKLKSQSVDHQADILVLELTKDEEQAKLLKSIIRPLVSKDESGKLIVKDLPDVTTAEELIAHCKTKYPYLCDGSGASGGGASGGRGGSAAQDVMKIKNPLQRLVAARKVSK